jgi:hypothetical protein
MFFNKLVFVVFHWGPQWAHKIDSGWDSVPILAVSSKQKEKGNKWGHVSQSSKLGQDLLKMAPCYSTTLFFFLILGL